MDRTIQIAGLLAVILVILSFGLRRDPSSPPPSPEPAAPFAPPQPVPELYTVRDTILRGDTFTGALVRNGLAMQEIIRILERNRELELFSPRNLRPGNTLVILRDELGALRRLDLALSPEETYVFESRGGELAGYLKPVRKETRLRKLVGDVAYSLDQAVHQAGGDARLTLKMSEVFEYDIDFFTDVRTGDRFRILVEERFVDDEFVGYGEILYGSYAGDQASSAAVWFRAEGTDKGGYYEPGGGAMRKLFLKSPLNYRRISSAFSNSRLHPILKIRRPHHGVDYAAPSGTPVVALGDGVVAFCGSKSGYGNLVELRHPQERSTRYGHLSRFGRGIKRGTRVKQGQVIGYVGQTGLATGPHLHFEVRAGGVPINPLTMKNVAAEPIPERLRGEFAQHVESLRGLEEKLLAGQVLEEFDSGNAGLGTAELQTRSGQGAVR